MDSTTSHMFEKPVIALGHKHVEGFLTILLFFVLCKLLCDVASPFYNVWRDSTRSRRGNSRSRSPAVSSRQVYEAYIFLVMAAVAFVVVNWVRLDMKDNLLILTNNTKGDNEWHEKTPSNMWETTIDSIGESTRKIVRLVYPNIRANDPISTFLVEQAKRYHEYDLSQSLWDCFRMDVATYCRFWWTQQWFMGYAAWAMFVGVQARQRGISSAQVFAFIVVGYVLGLAGAQCLFYAVLRLKPYVGPQAYFINQPKLAGMLLLSEALLVVSLPVLLVRSARTIKTVWFSLAQAYVMLQPAVVNSASGQFLWKGQIFNNPSYRLGALQMKRIVLLFWFAFSMASLAVHMHSWCMAFREIRAGKHRSLYQHNFQEVFHPSSWGNILFETTEVLFSGLRLWNHWLRALGYDVLLSLFSLMVWAAVNQSDVHGMVKCSINPYLDEVQAAAGQAVSRLGEATEEMYDELLDSQPLARTRDAWSSAKEEARRRTTSAMHSFADTADEDDEEENVRPTRNGPRSSTRRASGGPGRPRSRSRGAVSPTLRNASSRRSSTVREPTLSRRMTGVMDNGLQLVSSPTMAAVTGRAEAVVLTYALGMLGGLGMASVAVFGAD